MTRQKLPALRSPPRLERRATRFEDGGQQLVVMSLLLLCALCACGRIGFDRTGDAGMSGDADADPFQEAAGQLDPTFGGSGVSTIVTGSLDIQLYQVVTRSSGGYLAIGVHRSATGAHFGVFAFDQSGALDTTFGGTGISDLGPTGNDFGYGAVRLPDGRTAMVGDGSAGTGDEITLAILDTAGVPDPAFGPGGFRRIDIGTTAQQDTAPAIAYVDGHLAVCGTTDYTNTNSNVALLAVGLDGTPVTSFGGTGIVTDDFSSGAADVCTDVVRQPSGSLAASLHTDTNAALASYTPAGTRDTAFGSGGVVTVATSNAAAYGVAVTPGGDLVTCGENGSLGFIARLSPTGTLRSSFGSSGLVTLPGIAIFRDVAVQPNEKIVAVGRAVTDGAAVVVRLAADGTPDATFGANGIVTIMPGIAIELERLLIQPEGYIVTAGYMPGSTDQGVIARIR